MIGKPGKQAMSKYSCRFSWTLTNWTQNRTKGPSNPCTENWYKTGDSEARAFGKHVPTKNHEGKHSPEK